MKKEQTTKTVDYLVKVDGDVGQLKAKMDSIKNSLGDLANESGLKKSFKEIDKVFDRLKRNIAAPSNNGSAFGTVNKDLLRLKSLSKDVFEELSKNPDKYREAFMDLVPSDVVDRINELQKAVKNYSNAMSTATLEMQQFNQAQKALERQKTKKFSADNSLTAGQNLLNNYKVAKDAVGAQLDNLRSLKLAAQAAQEEAEKTEELYKANGWDRRKKQTDAAGNSYLTPQAMRQKAQAAANAYESAGGDAEVANLQVSQKDWDKKIRAQEQKVSELQVKVDNVNSQIAQLQATLTNLEPQVIASENARNQAAYERLLQQADAAGLDLVAEGYSSDYSNQESKEVEKRIDAEMVRGIEDAEEGYKDLTKTVQEFGDDVDGAQSKVEGLNKAFEDDTASQEYFNSLVQNTQDFLGLAGAVEVFRKATSNAIATIKELDAVMSEMAVVTDATISDYWEQLPQYTERATQLGVSIADAYEASMIYYQQGLDTNAVIDLSTQTLKMARIAGLDAADATDRMTSALRGFNMELNETSAQNVADVYSELAAVSAADVDEISTAMSKVASLANSAGMTFEVASALLTQGIETTRESAETIGTSLKTVLARFTEVKNNPNAVSTVDGESVDANAIEGALKTVGISMRDDAGQFRDMGDVLLELSSIWGDLDTNTQRWIATLAAGSRRNTIAPYGSRRNKMNHKTPFNCGNTYYHLTTKHQIEILVWRR